MKKLIKFLILMVTITFAFIIILYIGRDYFKDTFLAPYVYTIQKEVNHLQVQLNVDQDQPFYDLGFNIVDEGNRTEFKNYIESLSRSNADIYSIEEHILRDFSDLEEYTLSESNNDTIYPGCLIRGDSLFSSNQYVAINTRYEDLELYSNIKETDKKVVDNVSFSAVSSVVSEYIKQYEGTDIKEWKYYLQKIDTVQQLDAVMGIKAFSSNMNINHKHSSLAVIFEKVYFTVFAEPKSNITEYFPDGTDISTIGNYAPAYVSSVDYGNRVVILVDGEMNSSELESKVGILLGNASIGAGIHNLYSDSELNCSLYGYGGEQIDLNVIFGETQHKDGLVDKWNSFWNGSNVDPALENRITDAITGKNSNNNPVPISYTLKYLSDNSYVDCKVLNSSTKINKNSAVTVFIPKEKVEKYGLEDSFANNQFPFHTQNNDFDIIVLNDLNDSFILSYKGIFSSPKKKEIQLKIGKNEYELDLTNKLYIEVKPGIYIDE